MDVKLIEKSDSLVSRLTEDHGCIGVKCLKCLPALLIEDLTDAGIADNTAIQSLTAENATLLFKCREAEEGWKNALIAPLTWQAELTAERDAALARVAALEAALQNPPPHRFWGAGEPDCPRRLKCGNGELHTMMCKVCGVENPLDNICRALLEGSKP